MLLTRLRGSLAEKDGSLKTLEVREAPQQKNAVKTLDKYVPSLLSLSTDTQPGDRFVSWSFVFPKVYNIAPRRTEARMSTTDGVKLSNCRYYCYASISRRAYPGPVQFHRQ